MEFCVVSKSVVANRMTGTNLTEWLHVKNAQNWSQHRALGYTILKRRCRPEATNDHTLLSACQVGPKPRQQHTVKTKFNSNRRSRILWSIVSNAADKSKSVRTETCPLSRASKRSFMIFSRTASVLCFGRYVDCGWLNRSFLLR